MIVFCTVLEIQGEPVLYNVYKNKTLAFLNPAAGRAPILFASFENSSWLIRGTSDCAIQQQALQEIDTAD